MYVRAHAAFKLRYLHFFIRCGGCMAWLSRSLTVAFSGIVVHTPLWMCELWIVNSKYGQFLPEFTLLDTDTKYDMTFATTYATDLTSIFEVKSIRKCEQVSIYIWYSVSSHASSSGFDYRIVISDGCALRRLITIHVIWNGVALAATSVKEGNN